ncbi:hypothetical protein PENTCL1PPCAC_2093, partial [Pristionchus entomophagus]
EAVEVNQKSEKNEREVDKEYLALLERKLNSVKNPSGKKATVKQFISDIASVKDHQLFNLLITESTDSNKFDDAFVDQPSLIQRKLAPQTCAVAASERLKLVKNDHVQKVVDHLEEGEEGEKKEGVGEGEKVSSLYVFDYLPQSSSEASTRSMLSSLTLSGNTEGQSQLQTQSLSGGSNSSFHPKMTQLEIVAMDAIEESRDRMPGRLLVLTCWGETCELGTTSKYQFVLFRIEMHTGKACVLAKEFIFRPVALVRFITYRWTKRGSTGILVFPSNEKAAIYQLVPGEDGCLSLVLTSDITKEYPELAEEPLPGTVVKMATETIGRFRWTLIGCDNGHLRFWRTTLRENKVMLIKRMRFFGAISVTDIYQPYKNEDDEEEEEDEPTVHVIVSSTLGPVSIYRVVQYRNHSGVTWEQRAMLSTTRKEDTVTCAARKGDYLCIGFFSQHMYTYNLKLILDLPPSEVNLPFLSDAKVNAPTAAIQFVDQYEISLITFAGHHSLMSIEDEGEGEEVVIEMGKKNHQTQHHQQRSKWIPPVGNGGVKKKSHDHHPPPSFVIPNYPQPNRYQIAGFPILPYAVIVILPPPSLIPPPPNKTPRKTPKRKQTATVTGDGQRYTILINCSLS